jgi:CRP-like cAMP-binding protein
MQEHSDGAGYIAALRWPMLNARLPLMEIRITGRSNTIGSLRKSSSRTSEDMLQMLTAFNSNTRLNRLLAALPQEERQRWAPHLESVEMPFGKVLTESGTKPGFVYFPTTAIVSLQYITAEGSSAELAVVGNEGIVGVSLFMGGGSTLSRALVRGAGRAFRFPAAVMMGEFERSAVTRHLLLRYTQALITQMAQTAVCNRHHSVDQQLCRWLLLSLDRSQGSEIPVTQEFIGDMLGVRREGITAAAGQLQKDGLIRYSRGRIRILDRLGLECRVCECYSAVVNEYSRLLRDPPAP